MYAKRAFTHVVCSDESHSTQGRYRAIALVTGPVEHLRKLRDGLKPAIARSHLKEFKWAHLRKVSHLKCAREMMEAAFHAGLGLVIRADVLTWDTEDPRHTVENRDDVANLGIMYFHLITAVLTKRWPDDCRWALVPDKNGSLNWDRLTEFLRKVGSHTPVVLASQIWEDPGESLKREFRIESLTPWSSDTEPVVQLADLLAGLGVFSRKHFSQYSGWLEASSKQARLFENDGPPPLDQESVKLKCEFLHDFHNACRARNLQVSLNSSRGLRTMRPTHKVNFWWYEAQHERDRAPQKMRR